MKILSRLVLLTSLLLSFGACRRTQVVYSQGAPPPQVVYQQPAYDYDDGFRPTIVIHDGHRMFFDGGMWLNEGQPSVVHHYHTKTVIVRDNSSSSQNMPPSGSVSSHPTGTPSVVINSPPKDKVDRGGFGSTASTPVPVKKDFGGSTFTKQRSDPPASKPSTSAPPSSSKSSFSFGGNSGGSTFTKTKK